MSKVFLLYNLFISLIPNKLRSLFHIDPPPSPATIPAKTDQIDLKRVFQMFDKNNDGRITKEEVNETLENLGIFMPEKDLIKMVEKMDVNGDGCVDIEEFECMYRLIMAEREEEMKEVFDVFDEDGDGFISVDELKRVMSSSGLKQGKTLECCQMMIMQVDVDGDGRVDYNEFIQMMKSNVSSSS